MAYMPMDGSGGGTAAGSGSAAPPVTCDFGPFGEQTSVNLGTLETQKLCEYIPSKTFFF